MRWIGLNDGYVSGDGRFLVAQVKVQGRKGPTQKWVVYGVVHVQAKAWRWTERPLHGPTNTKRECQEWALSSGYQPGEEADDRPPVQVALERPPAPSPGAGTGAPKRTGWEVCQECGVTFTRKPGHVYEDYCGGNCFAIVCERVAEIQTKIRAIRRPPPALEDRA